MCLESFDLPAEKRKCRISEEPLLMAGGKHLKLSSLYPVQDSVVDHGRAPFPDRFLVVTYLLVGLITCWGICFIWKLDWCRSVPDLSALTSACMVCCCSASFLRLTQLITGFACHSEILAKYFLYFCFHCTAVSLLTHTDLLLAL